MAVVGGAVGDGGASELCQLMKKPPSALSFSKNFLIITLSRHAELEGSGVIEEGGWASSQSLIPN